MSPSPTDRRLDEALPAPAVAPEAYTESYYRSGCMGAEAWADSEGGQPHRWSASSTPRTCARVATPAR